MPSLVFGMRSPQVSLSFPFLFPFLLLPFRLFIESRARLGASPTLTWKWIVCCLHQNRKLSDRKVSAKSPDKTLSDAFSGISNKKLSDKCNIKKQAPYQKDVKPDCDSIININLQKVPGDHHI